MGISGYFSQDLVRWLDSLKSPRYFTEISEKMYAIYHHMMGKNHYTPEHDFTVQLNQRGRLHLNCPGNSCGIDPEGSSYGDKVEGYQYGPHNVDAPWQQFILLAGLAALHDIARKEMK